MDRTGGTGSSQHAPHGERTRQGDIVGRNLRPPQTVVEPAADPAASCATPRFGHCDMARRERPSSGPVSRGEARRRRHRAGRRSRSRPAPASGHLCPDRPAAHARRAVCVSCRYRRRPLGETHRPAHCFAPFRRALGPSLARLRSLLRDPRQRGRSSDPACLAVPRLVHPRDPNRRAGRSLHS